MVDALGTGRVLVVAVPQGGLEEGARTALREAFPREYATTYGHASDEPLELVNVRVVATGVREHRLDFREVKVVGAPSGAAVHRDPFGTLRIALV